MNKIADVNQAIKLAQDLKQKNKTIILVGGCFDILHSGHIKFLNSSKGNADKLFLLLESDENIKKIKGKNRPVNSQNNRASILSSLSSVDLIIPLFGMTKGEDYDKLLHQIKPEYIAITKGDKNIQKRKEQCKKINANLIQIEKFDELSSTDYIKNINLYE